MEEPQFVGPDNFQGGSAEGLTFRQIVLNQVSRVTQLQSKEFHGGYRNARHTANTTHYSYVEDSREAYKNAVRCLNDTLFAHFDEEMHAAAEKFEKDYAELCDTTRKRWTEDLNKPEKERYYGSIDNLKNERAIFFRKLFQALILLLKRLRYLEGAKFEEDVQ